MTLLDKCLQYLDIESTDTRTTGIVEMLIEACRYEAEKATNADEVPDYILVQMVAERYNRWGHEGMASVNIGGTSESYLSDYSEAVRKSLRSIARLKAL